MEAAGIPGDGRPAVQESSSIDRCTEWPASKMKATALDATIEENGLPWRMVASKKLKTVQFIKYIAAHT